MQLEILTPEKKLYSGEIYGIQLPGISGSFEVLEKHAPMVSALGKGSVKVLLDKSGNNTTRFTASSNGSSAAAGKWSNALCCARVTVPPL